MEYDIRLTAEFSTWRDGLADEIAAAAVPERLLRVRRGLFGDHASVGDRVSELRIHHDPSFRVYFAVRGRGPVAGRGRAAHGLFSAGGGEARERPRQPLD